MYLFSSRTGALREVSGRAAMQPPPGAESVSRAASSSWMDSSIELKQGLDVVELDELPPELFTHAVPAGR